MSTAGGSELLSWMESKQQLIVMPELLYKMWLTDDSEEASVET